MNTLELLQALEKSQKTSIKELNGLFASHRFHPIGYRRVDHSAYFTATCLHTLRRLGPLLTPEENHLLENIREMACAEVHLFQNKQGLQRYNFWQTNPGLHFPNGKVLGRWDYFRPPDDVDDSVMIYQMQNRSRGDAQWLKTHIDDHANGSKKWINNTPAVFQKLRAYATFFSRDMPLGFDACVITNVLYFNCLYGFEKTMQDKDSMLYLSKMLEINGHREMPEKCAPYYPHTSIILYHLAKLIQAFNPVELQPFRLKIESDIWELLQKPLFEKEKTMLENAWMWLTQQLPTTKAQHIKKGTFYFFVLPLTLEFEGWLPQWLAHRRWTHLRFECRALEISFEIENLALKKGIRSNTLPLHFPI